MRLEGLKIILSGVQSIATCLGADTTVAVCTSCHANKEPWLQHSILFLLCFSEERMAGFWRSIFQPKLEAHQANKWQKNQVYLRKGRDNNEHSLHYRLTCILRGSKFSVFNCLITRLTEGLQK